MRTTRSSKISDRFASPLSAVAATIVVDAIELGAQGSGAPPIRLGPRKDGCELWTPQAMQ